MLILRVLNIVTILLFNIHVGQFLFFVQIVNPFSTGTVWTLYKVYGGFRISYGTG